MSKEKTQFREGHKPWNKNKKGYKVNRVKRKHLTKEERKIISEYTKIAMNRPEVKAKLSEIGKINAKSGKNPTMFKEKELHPFWRGGSSFKPYNINFNNSFRKMIRERDNQICMLCKTHREKLKRALEIHHIDYNKKLTTKENCISLCHSCHSKTNFNREQWVKFFQSLLSKEYGYKYYRSGKIKVLNQEKLNGN